MRGLRRLAPLAALLTNAAAIGLAQPPVAAHPAPLEDPSGRALTAFHAALRRTAAGRGRTRISVFGASHTASDQFPSELRRRFARSLGDAGPGWVPLTPPHAYYAHAQVVVERGRGFTVTRVRGGRGRGDYGASGWAFVAGARAEARIQLAAGVAPVDRALLLGDSAGARAHDGDRELSLSAGAAVGPLRSLSLRPRAGSRLTGVSLERDAPGVIVDSIGVPGSRLRDRAAWAPGPLAESLRRLAPDLLILAYGTNEAGIPNRSRARYRAEVDAALAALPPRERASCVLLGPSDWPERRGDAFRARARVAEVIEVQRAAAFAHGCAFLDLQALTGGPLSMLEWERAGLAVGDHVHFTDAGHARIGAALHRALRPVSVDDQ